MKVASGHVQPGDTRQSLAELCHKLIVRDRRDFARFDLPISFDGKSQSFFVFDLCWQLEIYAGKSHGDVAKLTPTACRKSYRSARLDLSARLRKTRTRLFACWRRRKSRTQNRQN